MSKNRVWGVDLFRKGSLIPKHTYMPYVDLNSNHLIVSGTISVSSVEQETQVVFDADVLTGQQVLGQWSYDVDADGKPLIQKRKYRVLTMRVEFEEID